MLLTVHMYFSMQQATALSTVEGYSGYGDEQGNKVISITFFIINIWSLVFNIIWNNSFYILFIFFNVEFSLGSEEENCRKTI